MGIARDSNNYIYIADADSKIKKFSRLGGLITSWDTQVGSPTAVAVASNGDILVTGNGQRVERFDSNGNSLALWGTTGNFAGGLLNPQGIAVDPAGNIYVGDFGTRRISKFDANGNFILTWTVSSMPGAPSQALNRPKHLACDAAGNVYAAIYNGGYEKFDGNGNLLGMGIWDNNGNGLDGSESVTGICLDETGKVYLTSLNQSKVQVFDSTTDSYLAGFGATGEATDFSAPNCIVAGPMGIVVGDTGNSRTCVWQTTPIAPVMLPINNQSIGEGQTLTFTASATDANLPLDLVRYVLVNAPTGMTINRNTGQITWTPSETQGGSSYSFKVRAVDSTGKWNETTASVTATETNQLPTLTLPPGTPNPSVGTPVSFTAKATDPDMPAQTLTFSLIGAPSGASINPTTGLFTWTPTTAGNYTFNVRVTDSVGGTATKSMTISVIANKLVSLTLSPSPIGKNATTTGTLLLNFNAPSGGVPISLTINKAGLTLPTSVTIPQNQSSITFAVSSLTKADTYTITANSMYGKVSTTLVVTP